LFCVLDLEGEQAPGLGEKPRIGPAYHRRDLRLDLHFPNERLDVVRHLGEHAVVPLLVLEDETNQVPDGVPGGRFLEDLAVGVEERPFSGTVRLQQVQDLVFEVASRSATHMGGCHDGSPPRLLRDK
jgi:hypothetical protein